ncbi:MAG TPA: sugar phosphate isomerase/epimerase [Caldilineaceae bacterium]|nr:sugar phosphate isomerase/epimerase [Caldilineaceae bacterium]
MTKLPIALELYSVRDDLARDVRGTLQAVAKMGYAGVEFAGPPRHPASELKALLDEFGLLCAGWHVPFSLVQDDKLDETIAFHHTLGNNKLIIPGIPAELRQSRADWLKLADFFNRLADKLAVHDLFTGYHNHHIEFVPLEGERPWDTFFGHTRPAVIMQLDTGNAVYGQADILELFTQYPGRAVTVHLKPYSFSAAKANPANEHAGFQPIIGEDETPWADVFQACETVGGTQWYIVEYESDAYPPLEAVDRCLQALRAMGK